MSTSCSESLHHLGMTLGLPRHRAWREGCQKRQSPLTCDMPMFAVPCRSGSGACLSKKHCPEPASSGLDKAGNLGHGTALQTCSKRSMKAAEALLQLLPNVHKQTASAALRDAQILVQIQPINISRRPIIFAWQLERQPACAATPSVSMTFDKSLSYQTSMCIGTRCLGCSRIYFSIQKGIELGNACHMELGWAYDVSVGFGKRQ